MATGYLRVGGAWVQSGLTGKVRPAGVDIPFSPPSAGVDEWLLYPDPLSNNDWFDLDANVGVKFAVTEAASWVGVRFWRSPTPTTDYVFGGVEGDTTPITPNTAIASAVQGAFVSQLFAAPVAVIPGTNYIAAYHCSRYGFSRYTDGAVAPFASVSSRIYTDTVTSAIAFYTYTANRTPDTSSQNFHFNISPIIHFSS